MKLTSIELTNFKAIGESVVIPVRPITLFFGANSAGKSSILQCLAMLAQSVTVEGLMGTAHLSGRGSLVDAGNYRDFIHQHDITKPFECKFNFDMDVEKLFGDLLPYDNDITKDYQPSNFSKRLKGTLDNFRKASLSFHFHFDAAEKRIVLDNIGFYLDGSWRPVFSYLHQKWELDANLDHIYWKKYFNAFSKEIYEKLYAYPVRLAEGRMHEPSEEWLSHIPEPGKSQIKARRLMGPQIKAHLCKGYDYKSLIEIYCLLYPEKPLFRQLRKESQQGRSEFELVLQMYNWDFNSNDSNQYHHLPSEFSGFLPSKFAFLKPDEFLCAEFIEAKLGYSSDVDFFHPVQLIVLIASHIKSYLESLSLIGPLRKRPERFYVVEEDESKDSLSGGNAFRSLAHNDELVRQVNMELDQLQTGYQIKIVHLADQESGVSGVFMLQFINKKTGVMSSIKDVGFGFSQILPVIVKCRSALRGTVIVEQPELHLHPALQAELGDMFIRGTRGEVPLHSGYMMKQDNRFFIETHSEHLILRLLRRIRETTDGELPDNVPPLTPDDIAVLYVQPGPNGSEVVHIPVTKDGEFTCPWPGGFFSERARELF